MFGKMWNGIKTAAKSAVQTLANAGKSVKLALVGGSGMAITTVAQASTDATSIATGAETAFGVVAPIVVTIATFFVIVRIAKRVVK